MISKARVYLNQERTSAVPEGHKDARFLLVPSGGEISDTILEKYKDAAKLVAGESVIEEAEIKRPAQDTRRK